MRIRGNFLAGREGKKVAAPTPMSLARESRQQRRLNYTRRFKVKLESIEGMLPFIL